MDEPNEVESFFNDEKPYSKNAFVKDPDLVTTKLNYYGKNNYSEDDIVRMRRAGLPKPQDCSYVDWKMPIKKTPKHQAIAYMLATGLSNAEIARQLGMSSNRIHQIARTRRMAHEVKAIQWKMYGETPAKRFNAILPKAIEVAEALMHDDMVKPQTRADVAFKFMDRALGKPKQEVELSGSLIRNLLEELDGKTIEIPKSEIEEAIVNQIENPNEELSPQQEEALENSIKADDSTLEDIFKKLEGEEDNS